MTSMHFDGIIEALGARIGSEACGILAETFGDHTDGNARRLAAAWNLCQGINTGTLEALGVGALGRYHTGPVDVTANVVRGYFVVLNHQTIAECSPTLEGARAKAQVLFADELLPVSVSIYNVAGVCVEDLGMSPGAQPDGEQGKAAGE